MNHRRTCRVQLSVKLVFAFVCSCLFLWFKFNQSTKDLRPRTKSDLHFGFLCETIAGKRDGIVKCFTTRVFKTLNFYEIIAWNKSTMDLSNILVQAVTANSVDGDYWGFTRQSDEESSSEGKRKKSWIISLFSGISRCHCTLIDTKSRVMRLSGYDFGEIF